MNPETLRKLIKNCADTSQAHSLALDKLDYFCEQNWKIIPSDLNDMDLDGIGSDRINGCINYGEYTISVDEFREIMDRFSRMRKNE